MQNLYNIKIYDGIYWDITAQRDDFSKISIQKDIADISIATITSPIFEGLKNLDRIDICTLDDTDTVIFSGFVKNIKIDDETMEIPVVGMKSLLQRKYLTADITTTSFDTLINTFLSQWAVVGETLTIERQEEFTIKNDTRAKWSNIYDILNEVCGTTYAFDYDILNRKIIVKKTLGNAIENVYTYSQYHMDNNISSVSLDQTENIRNLSMVFATWVNTVIDWNSASKYGILWVDSTSTEYIGVTKEFSLSISDDTLSAGDSLTIEILSDSYRTYYGTAYVVRESMLIEKWWVSKELEISTIISKEKTLSQLIISLQK